MEVLPMYDQDASKKKSSRIRATVRLFMRLLLRWKSLPYVSKAAFLALIVLTVFAAAFYAHSTYTSSEGDTEEWRRQLGRAAWHFLHTTAAQLPDKSNITATHLEAFRSIFRSLEVIYPCDECREHLVQNMKRMRSLDSIVDASSALVWTCELHNLVNQAQKKPLFPCDSETLVKKWSNPNCGCRSKKSDGSSTSTATADPPANDPVVPTPQPDSRRAQPTPASDKTFTEKADAIAKAQAKLAADSASRSQALKQPDVDVEQDSSAQRTQDAVADSAPDIVELPEGEVTTEE
jgi:hypothetical protein